ncbi:MAG: ATP-binding cassette domain-containing protein [Deltaproteobacteria bacterium]|nr:ATP-binding cassette domain-containing protein [Deltaproteobacteria bacterium]
MSSTAQTNPAAASTAAGPAIRVEKLRHLYGSRLALDEVSFDVQRGEIFGLLGPNGGGKTTLFKILSTLLRPTSGTASIFSTPLSDAAGCRKHFGVVFQQPSVDGKLTVRENLLCHGNLYCLGGSELDARVANALQRLSLSDRAGDRVETLSGGLQRRTELAKSLLHRPPLLLLDEPSTGLDPGARRDFLQYLRQLRDQEGVTIVLTTHYMEEAERCDRVAILHQGRLVSVGSPASLKGHVGGDIVVVQSGDPQSLQTKIRQRFNCEAQLIDGSLRIERDRGHELVRDIVESFPTDVTLVTYGKPTLEDVFIHLTGHRFWAEGEAA